MATSSNSVEKELPPEPEQHMLPSPSLAEFDFGIGNRASGVGIARGSGVEMFKGRDPDELREMWGDEAVDTNWHWHWHR